jgi:hypothetical protein
VAWCLADPKLGEREVAAELPGHARDLGALRGQMIVLADKGLAGREMERYATDQVKVLLARPDRKDERRRFGNLAGMRQGPRPHPAAAHGQRPASGAAPAPRRPAHHRHRGRPADRRRTPASRCMTPSNQTPGLKTQDSRQNPANQARLTKRG